jgi:hypothetical protein
MRLNFGTSGERPSQHFGGFTREEFPQEGTPAVDLNVALREQSLTLLGGGLEPLPGAVADFVARWKPLCALIRHNDGRCFATIRSCVQGTGLSLRKRPGYYLSRWRTPAAAPLEGCCEVCVYHNLS